MISHTSPHSESRALIIRDCLEALYIRYRKDRPASREFDIEVSLANRDFESIPDEYLKSFFANAYEKHDGRFMPTNKQMLEYWLEKQKFIAKNAERSECSNCSSTGWISAKKEQDGRQYTYAFRCSCENGQRLSSKIWTCGEHYRHEGYERVR